MLFRLSVRHLARRTSPRCIYRHRIPSWETAQYALLSFTLPVGATSTRAASSKSSSRWLARQTNDSQAREAKVAGLKSRAAFKLLQINEKYRVFKPGQTVVDLVVATRRDLKAWTCHKS